MKLIIAEKREVGVAIANTVGARQVHDGYIEGNGYTVSWAMGSLIEKTYPCEDLPWDAEHLPIIPEEFSLRPRSVGTGKDCKADPRAVAQLKILKELSQRCDLVINAGDAGREGEVIQRYIYEYIGLKKPVMRLWVSSMEPKEILAALRDMQPSSDYDNLYAAGDARTEADWLVGINATRALSAAIAASGRRTGGVYSLGRVQTPTLALVCRRFLENRDFKSEPFWKLRVLTASDGKEFFADETEKHLEKDSALGLQQAVQRDGTLTVQSYESKERDERAPDLYDITAAEVDGIRRLGLTAAQVDEILENLYMKRLTTYPRTGSQFVTEEVFNKMPELLENIARNGDEALRDKASALRGARLNRSCVKPEKVTDHHAIIITGTSPEGAGLSEDERAVYDMICARLLEALSAPCHVRVTKTVLESCNAQFSASGRTVLSPGWRGILSEETTEGDDQEPEQKLPVLKEGDILPVNGVEVKEGATKPKPLYTEASLLQTMQNIAREKDLEEVKDALKEIGLGTPATRRPIIEKLFRRDYIKRSGKKIVPTETGLSVYEAVKDMAIASAELTGRWENVLAAIADGKADHRKFREKTRQYAADITREILENKDSGAVVTREDASQCKCPRCGKTVRIWPKNAKCPECGLILWREVFGKTLSESTVKKLLEEGRCGIVKGLTSKAGKKFDARFILVMPSAGSEKPDTCRLELVFDDRKKTENKNKKFSKKR